MLILSMVKNLKLYCVVHGVFYAKLRGELSINREDLTKDQRALVNSCLLVVLIRSFYREDFTRVVKVAIYLHKLLLCTCIRNSGYTVHWDQ